MKHAFLIITHEQINILNILLHMLDDARNDIYLHLDKKSDIRIDRIYSPRSAGFFLIKERMDVRWGDISQIEVELKLFKTAFGNGPYRYYHLLSGVDLPIKSQDYIHGFFRDNAGFEFVGFAQGEANREDCYRKAMKYHFLTKHYKSTNWTLAIRLTRFFLETVANIFHEREETMPFKKGSTWLSITNDLCAYIIDKENLLLKRFKHTCCCDEIAIQSIVYSSPFYKRCYDVTDEFDGCMREIDWNRGGPYEWTIRDKEILARSHRLFARKITEKNRDLALWIQETFSA